ncbi:MAG: hypothetical protein DI533_00825 [Cereibacter sphaeroides]|uniref:GIY-YIG nuclease family protein n=1 Tax=Cereibacter sphaeroides TaxID=1063 RepID=A0A2W5UN27_CERSP|nr:MAG: hypothetical protein DI533_00825 [Cereibacter sphaeroides]
MTSQSRKDAIAAYKERKSPAGIYAMRCLASDEVWVGKSPDLDKIENRLQFTLGQGGATNAAMQAAWATHGADSFRFEVLEQLDDDLSDMARNHALKARHQYWRDALKALAA